MTSYNDNRLLWLDQTPVAQSHPNGEVELARLRAKESYLIKTLKETLNEDIDVVFDCRAAIPIATANSKELETADCVPIESACTIKTLVDVDCNVLVEKRPSWITSCIRKFVTLLKEGLSCKETPEQTITSMIADLDISNENIFDFDYWNPNSGTRYVRGIDWTRASVRWGYADLAKFMLQYELTVTRQRIEKLAGLLFRRLSRNYILRNIGASIRKMRQSFLKKSDDTDLIFIFNQAKFHYVIN